MPSNTTIFLLLFVIFAFCLTEHGVYAFGAGNIPSFAYMEGRAFRHGDIEDVLSDLIKKGAGSFALTAILSKGSKFNGLDIKRVYFGNWLRDYSQAVDIASLKKVQLQTIINLCMVLGFLAHGYATHEFEVTPERLGCYLPTEHIDNPKGYGDGEDARKYHPGLRGPVDPRELEIDYRTGMKNYIANENGTWDTSRALVRRTLERCIHLGRQHRSQGRKQDEYEAYRLLGQALHTLEDFPAHSNFCELALVSMGHPEVFVHVGDQVKIQAPGGRWVAPIVTGSFGSSDFIHSLLGEASDHLSEASVTDLNREIDRAKTKSIQQSTRSGPSGIPSDPTSVLRQLFTSIPGSDGNDMSRDMDAIERIRAGPAAGGKNPEEMSPQELHAVLWQVLTFRDSVVKKISKTIEKIPGLGPLIEKIQDGISVFVFTTLEPFLKPILKTATSSLATVSGEVIDTHDQYEVFNDPRASDPTHSFLSKDHFNLVLNEPAGRVAQAIVHHAVTLVVKAWDNTSENIHVITEDILQCLFHPDFHNPSSKIQREMLQTVRDWHQKLGSKQRSTLSRLSKDAVRNHDNIRLAGEGGAPAAQGSLAASQGHQFQHTIAGYAQGVPGAQALFSATGFGTAKSGAEFATPAGPPPPSSYSSGPSLGGYPPSLGPPPTSSYPSMNPPPVPPSGGGGFQPPTHSGYAPSYGPSPGSQGPTFPGGSSSPSFPSFPGSGPAPPGGFSSFSAPSGPPPGFPGGPGSREPPGFPSGLGSREPPGGFGFPGASPPPASSGPGGIPEPFGGLGFPSGPPGAGLPPFGAPEPDGHHHHHHDHHHHSHGPPGGYGQGPPPPGW
ncbi:Het-C-domain-containing protein [Macrolepiota fuliginosa MF-IS2]|uniref:Het-C-domain-containing protein n=1 Tax=Macrolepiota fuliginosa MF-IS2 TaxID=1400762 RepID=A0A9P6C3N3_9AGAR|nr:Het-C-domain-containing protein [Macrolepiota fuliginosa MF-IS2]